MNFRLPSARSNLLILITLVLGHGQPKQLPTDESQLIPLIHRLQAYEKKAAILGLYNPTLIHPTQIHGWDDLSARAERLYYALGGNSKLLSKDAGQVTISAFVEKHRPPNDPVARFLDDSTFLGEETVSFVDKNTNNTLPAPKSNSTTKNSGDTGAAKNSMKLLLQLMDYPAEDQQLQEALVKHQVRQSFSLIDSEVRDDTGGLLDFVEDLDSLKLDLFQPKVAVDAEDDPVMSTLLAAMNTEGASDSAAAPAGAPGEPAVGPGDSVAAPGEPAAGPAEPPAAPA